MDVTEAGALCALLMELWQRGLITEKDILEWTGQCLRLEWGNTAAVERVLESIGTQKDQLGEILKGGVYRAALRIGELKDCDALRYALYGKGGAAFVEEVRHTPSWALNMAVASRGADHLKASGTLGKTNRQDIARYYFGDPRAAEPLSTHLKGASSAVAGNRTALINSFSLQTRKS